MSINIEEQNKYQLRIGKQTCQMSPLALSWIELFLSEYKLRVKKPIKILEFGSGLSTIWFAENFPEAKILSIEGDKDWYDLVQGLVKGKTNVEHLYREQSSNYRLEGLNPEYFQPAENGPFTMIINDGGAREFIGELIKKDPEKYITKGGIYLRHDYEKAIMGDWIGYNVKELGYDKFCAEHEGYELLTVSGNGKWGYKGEFGGIWRR